MTKAQEISKLEELKSVYYDLLIQLASSPHARVTKGSVTYESKSAAETQAQLDNVNARLALLKGYSRPLVGMVTFR